VSLSEDQKEHVSDRALASCWTEAVERTIVVSSPSPATSLPPTPAPNVQPLREVAILYHNAAGHAEVIAELRKLLPVATYRLTTLDVQAESSRRGLDALRGKPGLFTVAIGQPAATFARDQLKGPVLFAQVFNYKELMADGRSIRGVAALPPLDLQIQDWKKLDPQVRTIGLIVSQSHTDLIAQAELAAKVSALTIKHEISGSDRETLYLFKRLAPQIDGLWLVPDDRILSPGVLRELLDYAISHRVRVCVFSDALLDWGALMSASPTSSDIARTLYRVLETMMAGKTSTAPPLTPVSEVAIRMNMQVAGRFRLSSPQGTSWVVRRAR
jgi:ABC-type uncharacterized transport system substrate-binding protein